MWKEFKEFAFKKGNFIDLAVAVVIGTAFSSIVSSFVDNIIMPLVGMLIGGIDITDLKIHVGDAEVLYGTFLQEILDFFIIAFSIFFVIRFFNRFKRKEEPVEEAVEEKLEPTEQLLTEIRDLLQEQNNKA
ncbi:large conductance mechanosensitive channel protein MscL [Oceanobacillus piezotolerans]|uniref:Large-conductance mechanosensitive channel n=1 Tax=Oceanobacillus piezotolerans TaxID=2448030 RepID=A0A498D4A5_9BACI|nr:large conductance mechanosensitive channel protein MscL [Oceanobacillus piezotolerans]RLL43705.1 large conductance mechanosensitive channel protein MscL [Oceanobacillus piezotolerans]